MATLNIFAASGGGAKGAFQGGVLEALCAAGVELHGLVGVSTGAIQAGFMSMAQPGLEPQRERLNALREAWFGLKGEGDVYDRPALGGVGVAFGLLMGRPSLFGFEPFARLLERHITEPPNRQVLLGAVDLESGEFQAQVPHDAKSLRKAILASCSIPFFFPPVQRVLVDGGVREIAPVGLAFDLAAAMLQADPTEWDGVAIYVALASPLTPQPDPRDWMRQPAIEIGRRALELLETENYRWDVVGAERVNEQLRRFAAHREAVARNPAIVPSFLKDKVCGDLRVFEPEKAPYAALTFDPPAIRKYWEHGRERAEAVLGASPA